MTPSFNGWITRISGGVRPIIALASLPTARTEWSSSWIETIDGSLTTMPSPCTYTSVFDVPRSIATSLENRRSTVRPLSVGFAATRRCRVRHQRSGPVAATGRNFCGSACGRADRVEELSAGERLVEERGAGVVQRLVGVFADRARGDEDEPVPDCRAAGRDLAQELEPVDPVEVEVRHHQVDPVAQMLARLVGARDGERRAARRLEVLEQDLLHRLVVLDDQDALAVEVHRRPGLGGRRAARAADGQIDRERRALAGPAVRGDQAAVLADDAVRDAEPEPGAG